MFGWRKTFEVTGYRTACQDFLTLWKDADSDIPILKKPRPSTQSCNERT
jgi:hypothetical protein